MVQLCGGKFDGSGNYQNGGAGGNQSFKPASNANNAVMGASGEVLFRIGYYIGKHFEEYRDEFIDEEQQNDRLKRTN